jgi:hypothetical protein
MSSSTEGFEAPRWREKRISRVDYDYRKRQNADRERHRRQTRSLFRKATEIVQDSEDVGRDLQIYICIFNKFKDGIEGRYTEFISHHDQNFPPDRDDVVSIFVSIVNQSNLPGQSLPNDKNPQAGRFYRKAWGDAQV